MSLQTRLEALVAAIGADVKSIRNDLAQSGSVPDVFDIPEPDWIIAPIPNATTTASSIGSTYSAVGTATASGNADSTTAASRRQRLLYRVTTAASGAIVSVRQNHYYMGPIRADGWGGFKCFLSAGPDTGTSIAGDRFYLGLRPTTSAPTNVDPSTLPYIIGLGYDATDTNVQIMHNDGTGTATKLDTGWPVPSVDSSDWYSLELASLPTEGTVQYRAKRYTSTQVVTVFSGVITTDLPTDQVWLCASSYHSTGSATSVVGLALGLWKGTYALA